jgi:carbon storage regulator
MLVLRRKAGEAIVLNGVITIHVLAVEGERVKLGISAPPEVVIVRSELLENQGSAPPSQGQSGPYWPNRDQQRPPRDRGAGPGGAEGRGSSDLEVREATALGWAENRPERPAAAPIRTTPLTDE